jgi:hypothetical protein
MGMRSYEVGEGQHGNVSASIKLFWLWAELSCRDQADTVLHAFRLIQLEQPARCPAYGSTPSESTIRIELEMIVPLLSTRIKEDCDLARLRIN